MNGRGAETLMSASREQQWQSLQSMVRDLEETRDLQGLVSIAEMSLTGLRQLCERPITCEELDEILERIHQLEVDAFELGDEQ